VPARVHAAGRAGRYRALLKFYMLGVVALVAQLIGSRHLYRPLAYISKIRFTTRP
jgi:hypothetical protein